MLVIFFTVYFFTLPPLSPERNCNGTVVAIQFCYHAELMNNEIGELRDIFEFLVTDRRDRLFIINSRFRVKAAVLPVWLGVK